MLIFILFSTMPGKSSLRAKTSSSFLTAKACHVLAFSPLHAFSSFIFSHFHSFSSCREAAPFLFPLGRCHFGNSSPMDSSPPSRTVSPTLTI
nr:putative integron gene cassette protein [uncultured bacterium]